MKLTQQAMLTLALSLTGVANATDGNAPTAQASALKAAPHVLQVVRMQAEPLEGDSPMVSSFNSCTDAIRSSARDSALDACDSALRDAKTQARELQSSPLLHGTIDNEAINNSIAAAYSNAALAYWRAGNLQASRDYIERARTLAPNASFVLANSAYLNSVAAEGASLAKN